MVDVNPQETREISDQVENALQPIHNINNSKVSENSSVVVIGNDQSEVKTEGTEGELQEEELKGQDVGQQD